MDRHNRQLFHRLQQTVNLRAVHQPLGDLVQHRAVVFVQPEDQIRQQHIGKSAKHIQLVACDQLAVPDLPIGDVMLQRAELMLVFHHGVIIVVRQKHPDKRRMRHQMAVAFQQFIVDAGVIQAVVAKARALIVVNAANPVAHLLFCSQRRVKRDVAALAVTAQDDVT